MDASAPHPSDQDLRDYGLGQLDDGSAESVHSHLESCPDCRRRVSEVSSDNFLGRLRDARPATERLVPAVSATDGLSMLESAAPIAAMPPPTGTLPPGLADHPDYEIVRELGRGGMGVVYLAQNRLMGRPEVLKVVGGHLISRPAILERFLREIRSAARLHHPNIVTAYSAMRLGDSLVLAMEYVEGLDLARLVKARGPLPVANACNYAYQAAMGLQHAHEHGMVHRDIKPANLMLARAGNRAIVKVLDFGLAKVTSEGQRDSGLTREGQMLGTPDYIAPEQIRDAQSADIRADIYSLGCTLYYLLSGGPPFRGENLWDVYQAHFSMDASPLNLARPEVPVELAALVSKMMAKESGRRFREPGEVAQALKPFFRSGDAGSVVAKPGVSLASSPETTRRPAAMAHEPARPNRGATPSPIPADARPAVREPGRLLEGLINLGEPGPLRDTPLDGPVPAKAPAPIRDGPTARSMTLGGLRGKSPPRWWAAAGVLLLVLIVAGAAAVLRLKTRDGVIVLENLPEQAEVYVDGGRVTVSWPDGGVPAEITIPPGPHGVQVKMEGFSAFGEEVVVDAGGRRGIRVRLERPGGATAAGGESTNANRPAGSRSPAPVNGADRGVPDRPTDPPISGTTDRTRFTGLAGRWETRGDELVQSDSARSDSMLLFGDESWADYDFTVDAMRTGGRNSFSLIFRSTRASHGYEYVVASGDNTACYLAAGASRFGESFGFSLDDEKWYTARVHIRGSRISCSLYDCGEAREVGRIDVENPGYPTGRVGLGTLVSSYRFKNIRVTSPDGKVLWSGPPAVAPELEEGPGAADLGGFAPIFNGSDLAGWTAFSNSRKVPTPTIARVSSGEIVLFPMGQWGGLRTDRIYQNFTLRLEYLFPEGGALTGPGSGIIILPTSGDGLSYRQGIECQVRPGESGDLWAASGARIDAEDGGGRVEKVSRKFDVERPRGRWNTLVVRCEGFRIVCELNGREVNRAYCDRPISGWIGLMNQGSDVRFRNIKIEELGPGPEKVQGAVEGPANPARTDAGRTSGKGSPKRPAPRAGSRRPADAREFLGKYYKVFPQRLTWHEARERCQAMGGHLAIVSSGEENAFLTSLVKELGLGGAWLGATDERREERWIWVDGTPLRYSNWDIPQKQPNNKQGIEHYMVLLTRFNGTWCDQPNDGRQEHPGYICQWDR